MAAARTGSGGSRPRACDLAAAPFPDQWRSNDGSRPGGTADDANAGRGGGGWREQPVRTCSPPTSMLLLLLLLLLRQSRTESRCGA